MLAADLLADLTSRDIRLRVDGDKVKARGYLTDDDRERISRHKDELLAYLRDHPTPPPNLTADDRQAINEAIEERAAIREHEAGEPRADAERHARDAMRVYRFRVTDRPADWITYLAPGCDLEEIRRSLIDRFGSRLIEVREHQNPDTTDVGLHGRVG